MYCSRCGFQNEPGNAFCSKCGTPLEQLAPPQAPPQEAVPPQDYVPPQGYAPPPGYMPQGAAPPDARYAPLPPKKKRTGLVIGLIAGGVALVGALAAVYFLVLAAPKLDGTWVCEDRGWVLQIKGQSLTEYSPSGTDTARYSFENGKGEAALRDGGVSFTVTGDRMSLTDEVTGDRYLFTRDDSDTDIEEVVISGFAGLWSSEELGEVLEFAGGGRLNVYSGAGDFTGSYDYDIRKGEGSFTVEGTDVTFSAGWDTLSVGTIGPYARAEKGLDVTAFVGRFANPLPATWYETTGAYGEITFGDDGTFTLTLYGETFTGTYTYDTQAAAGIVTIDETGDPADFTYTDGTLTLDGMTYTQDYVAQPTGDDVLTAIAGIWYDTATPGETVTFYTDRTVDVGSPEGTHSGTFTFNPLDLSGVITVSDDTQTVEFNFYLSGETLYVDEYTYSREEPVVTETGSILGTWYDTEGLLGTLYFDKDGMVIMESYGVFVYGSYAFDAASGVGSMSLEVEGSTYTLNVYMFGGSLYTDDGVYTKDFVAQAA